MDFDEVVERKLCELLADRSDEICDLALDVRRELRRLTVDASELLYQTYAVSNVFSYSHRLKEAFLHIATYSEHVNLGFNQGTLLADPDGLLEGSGKLIRHIRIHAVSDLRKRAVKKLILAAVDLGREMAEASGQSKAQELIDKA